MDEASNLDMKVIESNTLSDEDIKNEFEPRIDAIIQSLTSQYDPLTEQEPEYPAYHESFKKAQRLCEEIATDAVELLKLSTYQDSSVRDLRQRFQSCQTVKYPETKKIAIFGNSGVGKSTLINALLDSVGLASTGSGGEACTTVATEFSQPLLGQTKPFQAEILFYEREQVREIIKDQVEAYHLYYSEEYGPGDELEDVEEDSNTAFEAFKVLFADRDEFCNDANAREFLQTGVSYDNNQIIDQMCEWIEELREFYHDDHGLCIRVAETAEEISGKLELFVSTYDPDLSDSLPISSEQKRASLWPIISLVRVGMHSSLLQRGLAIADLPGRSDTNKIRVHATDRYMKSCYYFVLVADVKRVLSDSGVHRSLQKEARRFQDRNALVCTQIDDLSISTNARSLNPSLSAVVEYRKILQARASTAKLRDKLAKECKRLRGRHQTKLMTEVRDLDTRLRAYEALQLESLIVMRNDKVRNRTLERYKDKGSALDVLFVSSHHYQRHKDGFGEGSIPLSLGLTGIPRLRSLLSSFPASSRFNVLEAHINGTLPSLIHSMEIWSSQSEKVLREQVREVVVRPKKDAENVILSYVDELKATLGYYILPVFRSGKGKWIDDGKQVITKMSQMHCSSLAAKFRHQGAYKPIRPKGQPFHSWNDDLLVLVREDVSRPWQNFHKEIRKDTHIATHELWTLLDNISEDMKGIDGASFTTMAPFFNSLYSKKSQLRQVLLDFHYELTEHLRLVKIKVTEEDNDAFLMYAMTPVYSECNKIKGQGKKSKQIDIATKAIAKGDPYARMLPGVKEEVEKHLDDSLGELLADVTGIFDRVIKDFDSQFTNEEIHDDRRDALQDQLRDFVSKAKPKLNGSIAGELAKAMMQSE